MLTSLCEVCGGGCEGRLAHLLAWALCLKTGAGSSSMAGGAEGAGGGRQMPEEGADPVRKSFRRQRATEAYLQQEEENGARKLP